MNKVVKKVLERQGGNFKNFSLKLELKLCDVPLMVKGDLESLTQVIDNLVDNALKYTPTPGVITILTCREKGFAIFEVKDTGLGIDEKYQDRIFQRFYRVDKQRSRAVGGTGLGLSIVKHLVHAMHGTISVSSVKGAGSTFKVRFPLVSLD